MLNLQILHVVYPHVCTQALYTLSLSFRKQHKHPKQKAVKCFFLQCICIYIYIYVSLYPLLKLLGSFTTLICAKWGKYKSISLLFWQMKYYFVMCFLCVPVWKYNNVPYYTVPPGGLEQQENGYAYVDCIYCRQCPLMCAAAKCRGLNEAANSQTIELWKTFHCDLPDRVPASSFVLRLMCGYTLLPVGLNKCACFFYIILECWYVDSLACFVVPGAFGWGKKTVGTLLLKTENPTMVSEITQN